MLLTTDKRRRLIEETRRENNVAGLAKDVVITTSMVDKTATLAG
jgi:hypothetical protein